MKRYTIKNSILLLTVVLAFCGCNQRNISAEASERDSITEFFKNFYAGCNDYYVQEANHEAKNKSYYQSRLDDFVHFLKGFCCDDIIAEAYRKDLDIYGQYGTDILRDSAFHSLHIEKVKYDRNVYTVHLQIDTLHIQNLYTLIKQNGKTKIYAIGKRKHPIAFCNDTLWIENSLQRFDAFNHWHGTTISSNYRVVDSLTIDKDYRVAILEPFFIPETDRYEPQIYSDRLLLVAYKNRRMVYDNIISNEEDSGGWRPYESLAKPSEEDFLGHCDFILSYCAGMGYKIYYTIGIKMTEGKPYVTGIRWEEHDSGLSFRKQITQEYDNKEMPLSSYSRCMPWELSQE